MGCKCGSILRLPKELGDDEHIRSPFIQFSCSQCKKKLKVKSESAGQQAKCPCGKVNRVPIPVAVELGAVEAVVAEPVATEAVELFEQVELFDDPDGESSVEPSFSTPATDLGVANNPYSSPQLSSSPKPQNQLLIPAIILLALASFSLLSVIASLPNQFRSAGTIDTSTPEGIGQLGGLIVALLIMSVGPGFVLWGAICMLRLKGYRMAYTGSIVALIPCLTPCVILGIPFGIWTLVLLNNPTVARKFGH